MIDLKAARADPEGFRTALARKGAADSFDRMLAADERWRIHAPGHLSANGKRPQTDARAKPARPLNGAASGASA